MPTYIPKIFISYSHIDEELKKELISHLSAILRRKDAEIWHDRLIKAGQILDTEISDAAYKSDIFLFLISPDFIGSDYCMTIEYREAKRRHNLGEAIIIPILLRHCDWKVEGIEKFNIKPTDALPVTDGAFGADGKHKRDKAWSDIVAGIRDAIESVNKSRETVKENEIYKETKYLNENIRNPNVEKLYDNLLFVDPDISSENRNDNIPNFANFCQIASKVAAIILIGEDRCGKTTILRSYQDYINSNGRYAVIINGKEIKNNDIDDYIKRAVLHQYSKIISRQYVDVLFDNFDECSLPDSVKEKMIFHLCKVYNSLFITSFTGAASVLFASEELPDPQIFNIGPLSNSKMLRLVENWYALSINRDSEEFRRACLSSFEQLNVIFEQTHIDKYPYLVINYLEIMQTYSGQDLYLSSFAACYDVIITQRLVSVGCNHSHVDEHKNFLSLVAYESFTKNKSPKFSEADLTSCLNVFEEQYFSSKNELFKNCSATYISKSGVGYEFNYDYIWYFLVARYIGKMLVVQNHKEFCRIVDDLALEIFNKKSANILIYISYFTSDNHLVESILSIVDSLFDKAKDWSLSDKSRNLISGLYPREIESIQSKTDISEDRNDLVDNAASDLVREAEKVVAQYGLPFLNPKIGDADYVGDFDAEKFDADSYLRSVNALLRTHSIIGQILGARAGTYPAKQIMNCIEKMVAASGRFVALNHAIATVMLKDVDKTLGDIQGTFILDDVNKNDMLKKIIRIFGFWSVYIAQAGLARYLRQDHNVRALGRLADIHESEISTNDNPTPFNYTSVYLIAKFYCEEDFDKKEVQEKLKIYGENSGIWSILRAVINLYSYYLPLDIGKKQWLSTTFHMKLQRLQLQQYRKGRKS